MEHSTEKKLKNLLDLQAIDSKIFEIKKVRGALPDEVQDLEDELVGYRRCSSHPFSRARQKPSRV